MLQRPRRHRLRNGPRSEPTHHDPGAERPLHHRRGRRRHDLHVPQRQHRRAHRRALGLHVGDAFGERHRKRRIRCRTGTPPARAVFGVVRTAGGTPVSGVNVRASNAYGAGSVTTGSDGSFSMQVAAGQNSIVLRRESSETASPAEVLLSRRVDVDRRKHRNGPRVARISGADRGGVRPARQPRRGRLAPGRTMLQRPRRHRLRNGPRSEPTHHDPGAERPLHHRRGRRRHDLHVPQRQHRRAHRRADRIRLRDVQRRRHARATNSM